MGYKCVCKTGLATALLLVTAFSASLAQAAAVNFSGFLDIIDVNNGGSIYAGVAQGSAFTGFIDDVTFNGSISGGGITTPFSCCIAAGGLGITNNVVLGPADAGLLNAIAGSAMFSAGEVVDLVDIEGDEATAGNGRIEVGLSYVLDQNAFQDESPSNYPFDQNDLRLALFFILEENDEGMDIYSAFGALQPVPVPAALWLFGSGLLGLVGVARRSQHENSSMSP